MKNVSWRVRVRSRFRDCCCGLDSDCFQGKMPIDAAHIAEIDELSWTSSRDRMLQKRKR